MCAYIDELLQVSARINSAVRRSSRLAGELFLRRSDVIVAPGTASATDAMQRASNRASSARRAEPRRTGPKPGEGRTVAINDAH